MKKKSKTKFSQEIDNIINPGKSIKMTITFYHYLLFLSLLSHFLLSLSSVLLYLFFQNIPRRGHCGTLPNVRAFKIVLVVN